MYAIAQDARFALRAFVRSPGFVLAALLSLAIGIGANTSIFSVANALLLRPLPYKDANRLVILWNRSPGLGITQDWFSPAQYLDIETGHAGFEDVAIAIGGNENLTGAGEPERVGTIHVSSNLLPMLGVRAELGRLFVANEDSPGRPGTALLSDGMWTRRYGRNPLILGQSVTINGQPYQVVGILPPSFLLPREVLPTLGGAEQADVLLPLPLPASASQIRTHEDYNIIGKLKRGVSLAQAQAEMETITARLRHDYPDIYPPNGRLTFGIVPLREQVVGDIRTGLLILLAAVGFVLLIACANVANLLLSRAVARQKEIAVRTALGATRRRLIRQLLTESLILALCGGALGILLAFWSVRWIEVLGTKTIPHLYQIRIDGRVLLFTLSLSILSGVFFGLAPALRVSGLDLHSALSDASRGSAGASSVWRRGNHLRRALVVSELALSVVLLIGAGLLIRSFIRLQSVQPGFEPRNVLTFELTLRSRRYADSQTVLNAYRDLWARFDRLPGVAFSGGISELPLTQSLAWTPITVEGRTPPAGEKFINADLHVVGWHYFQAMEIPLRAGRFFNESDNLASRRVVIVDERMAREFWPNEDPIGKRIHVVQLKSDDPWQTIVGVVGRVKHESLDSNPRITFYLPQTQTPSREMTITLRSGADPRALASAAKKELAAVDSDIPMFAVRTMSRIVEESLARPRFLAVLLGFFAVVALALGVIGIYGVMAYLVNQGVREIGIRIALGATQRDILRLVVRQGMVLALAGTGIGLAGALALTRLMQSLLFSVNAADALTFSAVPLLLIATALIACYIPARRAARVDPMISLRCE